MSISSEEELDKILREKFTSVIRRGYVTVDGVTMPERYLDFKTTILEWNVKEQDIWICSFPKTGTTWTQEMVWMIVNNLDFEEGQVNLGQRSPFLEVSAIYDYRDLKKNNKGFEAPPFMEDSLKFVKNLEGPVCLKTHLPFNLLPREIQQDVKRPKIIYVARNPKDTCISYYHHANLMEGFKGDFNEFLSLFLAGKVCFAPYWNHVLPFWERRDQENILFITYEEMKRNLKGVIRKVANFLEKPLSEHQIQLLTKHLSFEAMKQNKAVNYDMVVELNRRIKLTDHEGVFMRSGTVGSYKAVMSEKIIQEFDEWTENNTKGKSIVF